ncbi:periplasmic heavy metal sensor [Phenylobacterium sp.]|uniref:periplasmic heavy metal sensor n=1 Tax=Phenylobacterium sp. TaxID=1871053 RepID=UPI0025F9164B|nr:periplasmic heavy metal sensor [Phenylobacterium sp.]MBX3482475.1 periplasmic heavy metal sensor [Phenylobacterium sp.]
MITRTAWLAGALFVSLALNVFVGGAFLGAHLVEKERPGPPAGAALGARNPVAAAVATLSPGSQARWREQLPEYAQTYGPKMREARRTARQAMRSFGAEPFDDDQAMEDLARARALEFESRNAMDRKLVTFAAALPQAERARFGEALSRPMLRRAPRDEPVGGPTGARKER